MVKNAVITSFLGKTKDRFHEYNLEKSLEEKFAMVADMDLIDGVEVVFPYESGKAEVLSRLLDKYGLSIAAINVNIKAEPEFRQGGITSPEKRIRQRATQFIKDSTDFAKAVGADKVTCCPLGDGYEFSFQCDYASTWGFIVESFQEAAEHCKDIPLFIEYKPAETRGRCFVDTAMKTLHLINTIGNPSLGITVDFGHSIWGGENPAEIISLLNRNKTPYYIHINDNDGKWDWDYFVGTKHFLEYVEFLFYLQEGGYKGYLTSDTSPTRWDIKRTFEANARMSNKIWTLLETLDRARFKELIKGKDYLSTWEFLEKNLFGLK